ncbi:hypothetical protein [Sphingobium sp. UBA5915]|uniref:hypothetical protein n=1 Tax=Sphingobium sp. UBA5915 TaxID=1947530 RepID=UPI0025EB1B6C|nr:hypothetical protein [Sphingobium sp. UBA5915]
MMASVARDWQAMEMLPDDRRDGRDVLLWADGYAAICSWCDGWRDAVGREIMAPAAWADIVEPEGVGG